MKVTIGHEIAPGLIARFSRQFGTTEYNEATIEYYLSRILRLRATFSDAQSLSARSPFRTPQCCPLRFRRRGCSRVRPRNSLRSHLPTGSRP